MRTPWHIRAWAAGASLAINGALALGVMQMNAGSTMLEMEETGMLVSLGDPSLPSTDNATSPDVKPAPPAKAEAAPPPPPPEPIKPIKPRVEAPAPEGYLARAVSRPPAESTAPSDNAGRIAASADTAATPAGAKAMAVTAAKPPAGARNADAVQAHAGSGSSYAARARAWLESNKTYPKAARMRKQQGVARVIFVIDRAGHVLDCRLIHPSGHALLDQEALAMVARADPFPAPPHTIKGERIELDAPVEFSLER